MSASVAQTVATATQTQRSHKRQPAWSYRPARRDVRDRGWLWPTACPGFDEAGPSAAPVRADPVRIILGSIQGSAG